ncbi:MAG: NFACT family protein, partial [Synergistaceae bacterium]|nr:NFACT family protein [Synergistaceae bacterium]
INRDRVMKLEFRREIGAGFFQSRRVIFEACGRYSNIIVLDEDDVIVEAAKHILPEESRYRIIVPGSVYSAPPLIGDLSLDDIDLSCDIDFSFLGNVRGIGKPLIDAMRTMTDSDLRSLLACLKNSGTYFFQIFSEGNYVTLADKPLLRTRVLDVRDSLSASRIVVVRPLIGRKAATCRKKITSVLNTSERGNDKKIGEYEALASGRDEIDRLKSEGRLILENANAIPPRVSSAVLTEWTTDGPVERKISLDPERDASGNAELRFAKYRRKKAALEFAATILPELYKKRDELREQRVLLDCNDDWNTLAMMLNELEKASGRRKSPGKTNGSQGSQSSQKSVAPHKRAEFNDEGAVILFGLSARGNRYVTFKLAKADDLWLHAHEIPGAHVILRFSARPDAETLSRMVEMAASCAAFYSGGRDSGNVRVDCTERRHVRAIQGEGIANVTYKEFRTVTSDPSLWREFEANQDSL